MISGNFANSAKAKYCNTEPFGQPCFSSALSPQLLLPSGSPWLRSQAQQHQRTGEEMVKAKEGIKLRIATQLQVQAKGGPQGRVLRVKKCKRGCNNAFSLESAQSETIMQQLV